MIATSAMTEPATADRADHPLECQRSTSSRRPQDDSAGHRSWRSRPRRCSRSSSSCRSSTSRRRTSSSASTNWRPLLYAYVLWSIALGVGQVLIRGEDGHARAVRAACGAVHRRDGDLPDAVRLLHRLHRLEPRLADRPASSTALDNLVQLWHDPYFWNALGNMVFYVLDGARRIRHRLRPGAAAQRRDRARKFFRVVFLLPLHAVAGRRSAG